MAKKPANSAKAAVTKAKVITIVAVSVVVLFLVSASPPDTDGAISHHYTFNALLL
jgi:hypothetical protein